MTARHEEFMCELQAAEELIEGATEHFVANLALIWRDTMLESSCCRDCIEKLRLKTWPPGISLELILTRAKELLDNPEQRWDPFKGQTPKQKRRTLELRKRTA